MNSRALRMRCNADLGQLRLAWDVEFRAAWTVLFGASGSGKSSLLRLIAGLWRPAGSMVALGTRELSTAPPHLRRVGLVAQTPALFPHLSVRGNVAFGAVNREDVNGLLARFGIEALAERRVTMLSGGEIQRVSIARALAARPVLLLLDESFTGMHRSLREELIATLHAVQAERAAAGEPMPIVSVTHDVGEAFACADEVLRLDGGQLVSRGSASEVLAAERDSLLRQFAT